MLTKEQLLNKFGLSNKEAQVYIAAVSLGPDVAVKIATKAKINRGTIYDVLKSLVNKGLMSSYHQDGKVIFAPEDPDTLAQITANEEEKLLQKEQEALELIPQLKSLHKGNSNQPKVRFYEGKEGILAMVEDFLATKPETENLGISSLEKIYQIFPDYDEIYRQRRKNKGIKTRGITNDSKKTRGLANNNDTVRILPQDEVELASDITIYGEEKVSFIALEEHQPLGVVIEGDSLNQTMRQFFQLAWEGLN
ncbi:MAG: hypothetical protein A2788_00205 [Candidatus Abawacabacteria bacterium RIFCSPHIGHO2_01_FULL_46_8]|uniref:Transcription regulator TrmB N-terminal domain-containing protein n=1 Tax=Candidatus Abawacabacteria bacterium RIFCSPHIGHO2_01_FULL_46_8 TaxID=1817815 RepID=A0A1F4XJW7_9BACT|nr:MAG: hypothetical protein A2788_00205 [Candidatus Abawacabacteria bacterium RIFCSPHIGHO2_01_FULL_46_8]